MNLGVKNFFRNTFDNLLATTIVVLILIYLPIIFSIDFLDVLQNSVEDFYVTDYYFSGGFDDVGIDTNIVLVNLGELNRKGIAQELLIINSYKPKVIGIDAFYRKSHIAMQYDKEPPEPRDTIQYIKGNRASYKKKPEISDTIRLENRQLNPVEEILSNIALTAPFVQYYDTTYLSIVYDTVDVYLQYALKKTKNVVLGSQLMPLPRKGLFDYVYDAEKNKEALSVKKLFAELGMPLDRFDVLLTSNRKFQQYADTGFVNTTIADQDFRVLREFPAYWKVAGNYHLGFAMKIMEYVDSAKVKRFLQRGNHKDIVNFRRNIDKYVYLDADEVFRKKDSLNFLKDKIVLMGFLGPKVNTLVTEDIFFTPLNKDYYGKSYPDMYGVVYHANVISMLMDEDYIDTMAFWPEWVKKYLIPGLIAFLNMIFFNFIRKHYERWYEPVSLALTFAELLLMFIVVIWSMKLFHFEIKLPALLYSIVLSASAFETYHGSIKPIFKSILRKVTMINFRRINK